MKKYKYDIVIIGAGAAGLMCAIEAGKRGRNVLLLERNANIGEKIRISGGGRCNFTNLAVAPGCFLSQNPHFCKSALARYTSSDFVALVEKHEIAYHEKKLGQLFCNSGSDQIISMLLSECKNVGVTIRTAVDISSIEKDQGFTMTANRDQIGSQALVVASGGLSIPKLGSSDIGYRVAKQFGIHIVEPRPGLVPLLFGPQETKTFGGLSGISIDALVRYRNVEFRENILFTHRGLSGPAILQISSYWNPGEPLSINLLPGIEVLELFLRSRDSKILVTTLLDPYLPKRFLQKWGTLYAEAKQMFKYSEKELRSFAHGLTNWEFVPAGTEGFSKAEVTVGGVDTNELSSKTMQAKKVSGLYFIGEVVDVTGWLGGYNFQWAWSSGWVAGQFA